MGLLELTMRDQFIPTLKNQLIDAMPTFKNFYMKGRVRDYTGDRTITWRVVARRHQAPVGFKELSPIPVVASNPLEKAILTISEKAVPIVVPTDNMLLNKGGSDVRLLDIVAVQFKNAKETFQESINKEMFGDGSATGFGDPVVGFRAAVHDANTYAGIDRTASGNEYWKANRVTTAYTEANLKDNTSAGYLPNLLFKMYTNTSHGSSPDLIVMTKTLYNIHQLIASDKNLRFANTVADPGFPKSAVRGTDIIFDDYCPDKHIFFLTTEDWRFYVVPGANFDFDTVNGSIWKVPVENLGRIAHILWMGQLVLDSPWRQGVYTSLG